MGYKLFFSWDVISLSLGLELFVHSKKLIYFILNGNEDSHKIIRKLVYEYLINNKNGEYYIEIKKNIINLKNILKILKMMEYMVAN